MKGKPTIHDVAKKAKVSIATVSFVLNGKSEKMRVAVDTHERVLDAATALGYITDESRKHIKYLPFVDFAVWLGVPIEEAEEKTREYVAYLKKTRKKAFDIQYK